MFTPSTIAWIGLAVSGIVSAIYVNKMRLRWYVLFFMVFGVVLLLFSSTYGSDDPYQIHRSETYRNVLIGILVFAFIVGYKKGGILHAILLPVLTATGGISFVFFFVFKVLGLTFLSPDSPGDRSPEVRDKTWDGETGTVTTRYTDGTFEEEHNVSRLAAALEGGVHFINDEDS